MSYPVGTNGVVSFGSMESRCSSVGVVDRVVSTPIETSRSASPTVGNGSLVIQIYDLIVTMGGRPNSKKDF